MSTLRDDVYIGIDPGAKGSICALLAKQNQVIFKSTQDKPSELIDWVQQIKAEFNLRLIMIEDVHSLPLVSAKSNFIFGYNLGVVTTISIAANVMVDKVAPKKWQKFIGVTQKDDAIKKDVAAIALRLYPDAPIFGPRGGLLDGRSDALMIAHYAAYNRT